MTTTYTSNRIKPGSKPDLQRLMILGHAATPEGFSAILHQGDNKKVRLFVVCEWLIGKGLLFRGRRDHNNIRFFTMQEAADAYVAAPAVARALRSSQPRKQAPERQVEIVYPDGYKLTRIPTPAPRFSVVDFSFNHGHMRAL